MMNLERLGSCISKILLVFVLLLQGCSHKVEYYLDFYYASSCPVCKSFINHVIPALEEKYPTMEITLYNIDDESSIENYVKTCTLLKDYYVTDGSGSVPFIVLDGYFAQVGYEIGDQEIILEIIENAIEENIIETNEDRYQFIEGKTIH